MNTGTKVKAQHYSGNFVFNAGIHVFRKVSIYRISHHSSCKTTCKLHFLKILDYHNLLVFETERIPFISVQKRRLLYNDNFFYIIYFFSSFSFPGQNNMF